MLAKKLKFGDGSLLVYFLILCFYGFERNNATCNMKRSFLSRSNPRYSIDANDKMEVKIYENNMNICLYIICYDKSRSD